MRDLTGVSEIKYRQSLYSSPNITKMTSEDDIGWICSKYWMINAYKNFTLKNSRKETSRDLREGIKWVWSSRLKSGVTWIQWYDCQRGNEHCCSIKGGEFLDQMIRPLLPFKKGYVSGVKYRVLKVYFRPRCKPNCIVQCSSKHYPLAFSISRLTYQAEVLLWHANLMRTCNASWSGHFTDNEPTTTTTADFFCHYLNVQTGWMQT
jgi:hypothetical protein